MIAMRLRGGLGEGSAAATRGWKMTRRGGGRVEAARGDCRRGRMSDREEGRAAEAGPRSPGPGDLPAATALEEARRFAAAHGEVVGLGVPSLVWGPGQARRLRLIEELLQIIQESVKPMERIEGIKIFQVEGLGGGAPAGDGAARGDGGNLADQVVSSALRYRGQAPLIDALLKEIGLAGGDVSRLTASLQSLDADRSGPLTAADKPAEA